MSQNTSVIDAMVDQLLNSLPPGVLADKTTGAIMDKVCDFLSIPVCAHQLDTLLTPESEALTPGEMDDEGINHKAVAYWTVRKLRVPIAKFQAEVLNTMAECPHFEERTRRNAAQRALETENWINDHENSGLVGPAA